MNFKGKATRITDQDLPRIGALIGVGEDEIHAFLDVETGGSGFDNEGRPKMLFEPHVFYRELPEHKRAQAVAAGVAYARWGMRPYPRDSYPRLERAMEIDLTAALRSCSWGLGQVMGFNHKAAGYDSAHKMIEAFKDSEAVQLEGAVNFIVYNGLDDDLRNHDWRGFARGHNGTGYAKHDYHGKLERAFERWQRIKDTPLDMTPAPNDMRGPIDYEAAPAKKPRFNWASPFSAILSLWGKK